MLKRIGEIVFTTPLGGRYSILCEQAFFVGY